MNITIFPTGKGGSESAVRYLLSDTDHEGKKRSALPEILFGDPNTFTEIANATKRQHKYTSGVIAFRDGLESQSVTPEQITTLIETFRSTFMPGLTVDENFADFWVMHRDKGNVELHFLVANTELKTGQQLNIHPPGEKNIEFFNAFSAVMNDNFGFAQVVPDPLKIALKPFEAKSPNGKKDKKAKNDFATVLHGEIVNGTISNRNQLIGYMKRHALDVQAVGSELITVRLPGACRNTRLKGPLFSKDSDYTALVAEHHQSKIPKFLTPAEAKDQQEKLIAGIRARTAFNQRRYLTPKPGAKRTHSASKLPTANLPHRVARRQDELDQKAKPVPAKEIRSTLKEQLTQLKEQANPASKLPTANLPHRVARRNDEQDREGPLASIVGIAALGGLEEQIGNLSMQYHNLQLLLVSAKGQRAEQIKVQLFAVEQRLAALNLELEKKKIQFFTDPKAKPT
ncbi:relaxase/mobilization nuclease domain-containing protein [Ralstonia solanacearum]|uniref:relaxase/mobilization nuclease domain-containing protein n=1 Tax=Ralstonia solanacearum TaxID=305 RepID=UPI00202A4672|nr:relaxase/mobilization nuclease domain-containing protein [Ralstonia solanacearum]MCL9844632.1 relaxase/mobilization nuclease domain-containing protein [Ralstonia solanacearum]MDC6253149.1 relaxase/mobilization nuclease domain-containing protein [Ralstonia solanacearum]MDC6257731.1 relaxase/mobilization nuclease domain-containing protein [Ralstonia solanacearum]MDC6301613.1 relaxase/mobilization nuclease domain-containing protein [Ralstonia solanacearum]